MIRLIPLAELHPHPRNPRLAAREDVVDQIAAQIAAIGEFDPAHALIVRKNASGFEIVSGHHRKLAADKAGLESIPCWVREMSDEDAYMALVLNNAQGELGALEEGLHALGSGLSASAYSSATGKTRGQIQPRIAAAKVATEAGQDILLLRDYWSHLAEIHVAAEWAWPALVETMLEEGWTVEKTRKQAVRFKPDRKGSAIPTWIDLETIAVGIIKGKIDPIRAMIDAYEAACQAITDADLRNAIDADLENKQLSKLSDLQAILNPILKAQQDRIAAEREKILIEQREREARQERLLRLRKSVSLEEWKTLSVEEQRDLLVFTAGSGPSFNKQENTDIEWAQWSWNPITGCLHDCPYCYARDIANQVRMEKVYPNGFAPTLRPMHLLAPMGQKVPKEAMIDTRYKNVFTGSMADMFGRWVPDAWIMAVLTQMRANPQWNFLCLTKFPKRMAQFDIPDNVWMGTTVDLQARVINAETAFANVSCRVRWLSIEPMLEPITFKHLNRFHWIVIGGASASRETPEWRPPFQWIANLCAQADAAGCKVYMKTNLGIANRRLELPFDAPIVGDLQSAPEVFHYLGKAKMADQKAESQTEFV